MYLITKYTKDTHPSQIHTFPPIFFVNNIFITFICSRYRKIEQIHFSLNLLLHGNSKPNDSVYYSSFT